MANNKLKSQKHVLTKEERALKNKIRRGDLPKFHFKKEYDELTKRERPVYPLTLVSTYHALK